MTSDKKVISESFCLFFTKIGKQLQESANFIGSKVWAWTTYRLSKYCDSRFNFQTVKVVEVLKILKNLKRTSAAGYDNIPPSIVKDSAEELSKPLTYVINRCLKTSTLPQTEKIAKVTPVYKSVAHSSLDNYRPISVLTVFSKVYEKVAHHQLYNYLEDHRLLSPCQSGFRKRSSTNHAVTYLHDKIRKNMDQGRYTGAVYIDLKKAFDTVDHGCLLSKLQLYGIHDVELNWFANYLFNRKQFVNYDNTHSAKLTTTCGVPQGSILGPLLFILLINDMDQEVKQCELVLYADDTVLFTSHHTITIVENNLNKDLQSLGRWLQDNNLVINLKPGKTEFVMYGTHKKLSSVDSIKVEINNVPVSHATKYEYLGVTMDNHLTLTDHHNKMYKRVSARLKLMKRIRHNISPMVASTIYKTMIRPIMFYCNNIFLNMSLSQNQ